MGAKNAEYRDRDLQELVALYDAAFEKAATIRQILTEKFPTTASSKERSELESQDKAAYWARRKIAMQIAKHDTLAAYHVLVKLLGEAKYDSVKVDFVQALIELQNVKISQILLDIVKHERKDGYLLNICIKALGKLQESQALEPLLALLEESSYLDEEAGRERDKIFKGVHDGTTTGAQLKNYFMNSKHAQTAFIVERPQVIPFTLARIGDERAIDPLIRILEIGTHGEMVAGTIDALVKFGNKKAIPIIAKYLESTDSASHWGGYDLKDVAKEAIEKLEALP